MLPQESSEPTAPPSEIVAPVQQAAPAGAASALERAAATAPDAGRGGTAITARRREELLEHCGRLREIDVQETASADKLITVLAAGALAVSATMKAAGLMPWALTLARGGFALSLVLTLLSHLAASRRIRWMINNITTDLRKGEESTSTRKEPGVVRTTHLNTMSVLLLITAIALMLSFTTANPT